MVKAPKAGFTYRSTFERLVDRGRQAEAGGGVAGLSIAVDAYWRAALAARQAGPPAEVAAALADCLRVACKRGDSSHELARLRRATTIWINKTHSDPPGTFRAFTTDRTGLLTVKAGRSTAVSGGPG